MFVYKYFKNKYKTQDFERLRSADDIYVRRCRGFKYQMYVTCKWPGDHYLTVN